MRIQTPDREASDTPAAPVSVETAVQQAEQAQDAATCIISFSSPVPDAPPTDTPLAADCSVICLSTATSDCNSSSGGSDESSGVHSRKDAYYVSDEDSEEVQVMSTPKWDGDLWANPNVDPDYTPGVPSAAPSPPVTRRGRRWGE